MTTWTIVAYPQGSPDAPPIATVATRSYTLAQDLTKWFLEQGLGATRREEPNHERV
jgi:hypothetical protein